LTRYPLRTHFWLLLLALGTLARPVPAQTPAGAVPVKTYTGYYNDTAVYFASFETNDFQFAVVNNLIYAPHLAQVNESVLPQMIFFMNGTDRQTVVLQTEPGQPDYSPLWQVVTASWVSPDPMPLITSFAAAQQWAQQGKLVMQSTGILFNGPVFLINRSLNLQDVGTLAPTIAPGEFMGINPGIRTAYFQAHQGYYNGQFVPFLALEHAPGQISHAPGAIPVPTLSVNTLGAAGFARFYAVDAQPPVLDSVPIPTQQVLVGLGSGTPVYSGTASAGQPANAPLYSPVWYVFTVSFNAGVTPQPLRSVAEIQQAAAAGIVTVTAGRPDDTFNCPIPFAYQSGSINPGAATNPGYVPPAVTGGTPAGTPGSVPPGTTNTNPASTPPATGGTTSPPVTGGMTGNPY
jgi:hypothetical protein